MHDSYAVIRGPVIHPDPPVTVILFSSGRLEALRASDTNFFGLGKCRSHLDHVGPDAFDFRRALGAPTYYDITTGRLAPEVEEAFRRDFPQSSAKR